MKTHLLPALLLPALLLSSCDGELKAYYPTIAFDRLDVNSVDWETADTNFVFRVDNPNPVDITMASFDYALAFEGEEWLSGDDPDGLTLAAADGSEVALPVTLNFADLYDMVQAIRGEDTIDFNLAGSFGFDTPIGPVELPYNADGGFPALRTPSFGFDEIRVADLSLSGATIELDLDVDNDHASTLTFDNFDYTLTLEGEDVGEGSVATLGAVDGATTGVVTLPLDISFGSAGVALYSALLDGSGNVSAGLAASTDVETPFGTIPLDIDKNGRVKLSN